MYLLHSVNWNVRLVRQTLHSWRQKTPTLGRQRMLLDQSFPTNLLRSAFPPLFQISSECCWCISLSILVLVYGLPYVPWDLHLVPVIFCLQRMTMGQRVAEVAIVDAHKEEVLIPSASRFQPVTIITMFIIESLSNISWHFIYLVLLPYASKVSINKVVVSKFLNHIPAEVQSVHLPGRRGSNALTIGRAGLHSF